MKVKPANDSFDGVIVSVPTVPGCQPRPASRRSAWIFASWRNTATHSAASRSRVVRTASCRISSSSVASSSRWLNSCSASSCVALSASCSKERALSIATDAWVPNADRSSTSASPNSRSYRKKTPRTPPPSLAGPRLAVEPDLLAQQADEDQPHPERPRQAGEIPGDAVTVAAGAQEPHEPRHPDDGGQQQIGRERITMRAEEPMAAAPEE